MSTQEPERHPQAPTLTSLPRIEELPRAEGGGFTEQAVRDAFDSFRRHALQLQAQLRVLQAAAGTSRVEPTAHAVRMDALHLIRAAAEFADQIERDAQNASAVQLSRAEEEIRRRNHELQQRETGVERFRQESERQRADMVNQARAEAREVVANAERESNQELREAEARAARLLEQSRHQATELTNAARAEVEQTLEWSRAQASVVIARAQQGAEKLLAAAGLSADNMGRVIETIMGESTADAARIAGGNGPTAPPAPAAPAAPAAAPPPRAEPTTTMPPVPVPEPGTPASPRPEPGIRRPREDEQPPERAG
jgi:cell division septum initiation protein DivIVA